MRDTHHPQCEQFLHGTAFECTCRMKRRIKTALTREHIHSYAALPATANSLGHGNYWTAPTRSET